MMHVRLMGLTVAMGTAVLLAACGDTKLVGRNLPDETRVIDGPTLALPPQFELRPPRESADYESLLRAQKGMEARALIMNGKVAEGTTTAAFNDIAPAAGAESVPAGDAWLVQKTSAQSGVVADPSVRQALATPLPEEAAAKSKQGLFGRWFGRNKN